MRILALLLLGLLVYLQLTLWYGKGGERDLAVLREAVRVQRAEIAELQERNSTLTAEVQDLKQGLEAIEELARTDMGLIREGEVFYQIIRPDSDSDAGSPAGASRRDRGDDDAR